MSGGLSPGDPSSYSRPDLVAVTDININLTVDFERKILHGNVELSVERIIPSAKELVLDAKDLKVSKIYDDKTKSELEFSLSEPFEEFGSKLTIQLPESHNQSRVITINYETSPSASGLQWLSPKQTAGKKHPFLFSQFQAIHARSVIPCQDTPSVKTPYRATITAPKHLTALMSAIRKNVETSGEITKTTFCQQYHVPSYLIAIAVGALKSRNVGPRSNIWAEEEIIEEAHFEFGETDRQLKTAESLCGPYAWDIYDLLVLPPSFAFGGMENPNLTFVTPTLIAGDRSLANVVAHEIAHSWSGNLVTNKTFEHFWLNEGFTVYIERKIKNKLTSPEEEDFDAFARLSELQETIKLMGATSPLTKLVVDLKGVHPDDAFSVVPYEKGYTFFRYLERIVGGLKHFQAFMVHYFESNKFKSIDTEEFKSAFLKYFRDTEEIKNIDWDTWLYSPGMPPIIPVYDISRAETCDRFLSQVQQWDEKSKTLPINLEEIGNFTTEQRIHFLQKLLDSEPLSIKKLQVLDSIFQFGKVRNSEIKFRWFRVGIKAHWEEVIEPVLTWLNQVGRMKFVRPLYRDLYAWEAVRQKAIDNFQANKEYMMHVVVYTVSKDLHLS